MLQRFVSHSETDKVRNRIHAGLNRRNDEFLQEYFDRKVGEYGTSTLNRQQFTSALEELGVRMNEDDVSIVFRTADLNSDGVLNLEEFKKAVRFPSTIEQFISTLPITQVFADAMPDETDTESRLRRFSRISEKQVDEICEVIMPFLGKMIKEAVKETQVSFAAMDKSSASNIKFTLPDEMPSGTIGDFHRGLTARIGKNFIKSYFCIQNHNAIFYLCCLFVLSACPGEPAVGEWIKNMESEHCNRPDSHKDFTTLNYGITTTPAKEWEITMKQKQSIANMQHDRRLPNTEELLQSDEAKKA